MLEITSKDNSRIKEFRKLCTSRKYRLQSQRFALEGVRLVRDSLQSGVELLTLMVTNVGMQRLGDDFDRLAIKARETLLISDPLAATLAETESPQGVFAICEGRLFLPGLPQAASNGALLLCSLQDPGNVGTILRSADAFGLSAVVMTADCPDPAAPKVLRASMGAALRVAIYCADSAEIAVDALRQSGIAVYAAALDSESVPVDAVSLENAAVAIGNEGAGLTPQVQAACTGRVILPISEQSESLNAAMAATVFAWELSRCARGAKGALI
ncbi:TrmH family RNA methyltransferase [Oscillospiraceae bacterium LTW-04]|nr:RNA methyltransferase [Oscillospiraceae bacterium MB24-C1]